MPGLSNTVDEPRPGIYCNNCNAIIRKPDAPAVPSSERVVVVEEGPYTVTATDDATPPPLISLDANDPSSAPDTTAIPSITPSHPTAQAWKSPKNFTVTVPIVVHLPVEAFYRNFPTDASGRRRRIIMTNLTYDVTVELPETRIPSEDNPLPTSYARPVNPWSSTTGQCRSTVIDEPESLPRSKAGHYEHAPDAPQSSEQPDMNFPGTGIDEITPLSDKQLGMNASDRAGDGRVLRSDSAQNTPQLIKRPSEEEVIGHNWIKFHDEGQSYVSLSDNPPQMTTMQECHAPRDSRWVALRNKLRDTGEHIGEKLKGSGDYESNKLKKENDPRKQGEDRARRAFNF
ncbi:unnamed protein product [Alternaria alternata]